MSNRKERKPLPYSPQYGSFREQGSPTKASVLLQEDHAQYVDNLQSRKENFNTCLQLYRVSFDNQIPQKCLIHNNFITLYCENQFKLLCVNCIYGSAIHSNHRVVPSKNSIPNIARDNQQNLNILEQELSRVRAVDGQMKKNKKELEEHYRRMMKQIDEQFKEMHVMLDRKYEETRQRITESFSRAIEINNKGTGQVSWWRDTLIQTKNKFPKDSSEQSEIYKHLVLHLFMEDKLDEQKLTYLPSSEQIQTDFMRQVIQLRESIEQHVGSSYQPERSRPKLF